MSKRRERTPSRIFGSYTLPNGQSAPGELRLKGSASLLSLYSDKKLPNFPDGSCIQGTSYKGERLTLIDCVPFGGEWSSTWHRANVFPHYIAVGDDHLDPSKACIKAIHFTTSDLTTLFYDFDAFSSVIHAESVIDVVLRERREMGSVEAGEVPVIMYFTGKDRIVEVPTAIGKISVHHRPRWTSGSPKGLSLKNRIVVSIEPEQSVTFDDAVERMMAVACFLSMAAGRAQVVSHIHVTTPEAIDRNQKPLVIHPSHRWPASKKTQRHEPHPGDVPLDPIRRRSEFETVLSDWISRHRTWRPARWRYLECMRKEDKYDASRVVAAANLFDILPEDAVPPRADLPEALKATRDACAKLLREHPQSIDRDGALAALGRLGQPSLPKKVAHRAAIVEAKLGPRFSDLQRVAKLAVKVRNYFVHGSGEIEYPKVEPFVPFLTDTLEFIFAASDFIQAGWDAQRWDSQPHASGHTFCRFRGEYDVALAELRRAVTDL